MDVDDQWQRTRVQYRKLPNMCVVVCRQYCFCPSSRSDAPLQSVFTSSWFTVVRNSVSNLVGSNHGRGFSQCSTSDLVHRSPIVRTLHALLLGDMTVHRRSSVRQHVLVEHSTSRHSSSSRMVAGLRGRRESTHCAGATPPCRAHFIGGIQAFAENHVHRFSA